MPIQTIPKQTLKRHKILNKEQLKILDLLNKFRFATSNQLAFYLDKKSGKDIQKRLNILEAQLFIAKRYEKHYKLRGRPAEYYLLPKGAKTRAQYNPPPEDEPLNIRRIYKDSQLSENFMTHCLNITGCSIQLKNTYGDELKFYTKSLLDYEKYNYFPRPLPDALVSIPSQEYVRRYFFLDIFEANQPFFVLVRRIKKYINYAGSEEWSGTNTPLPAILIVCEDRRTHTRLRSRISKELRETYEEDLLLATTTLETFITSKNKNIWLKVEETSGKRFESSIEPCTLENI